MRDGQQAQHDLGSRRPSPPLKCVWMLAGVVDYKLCDRQYECETCPVDRAIGSGAPSLRRRSGEAEQTPALDQGFMMRIHDQGMDRRRAQEDELASALFYHPAHVWSRIEDEGRVRIGLDDFGQKLVGRIYAVSLPGPGLSVSPADACWRIAHRAGETTLPAPIAGVVHQVNERLLPRPSLINQDPYGQGWVMVVEPDHLVESLRRLYYGKTAQRWYEQQVVRLQGKLREMVRVRRPDVGATLQDGGSCIKDLGALLAAHQLRELIDTFLAASIGLQIDPNKDRTAAGEEGRR